jgi:uncharacterized membrane protein
MREKFNDVFNETAQHRLEAAVSKAELSTSGEIRLHVEPTCKEDVLDHAAFIFEKLEMHKTEERSGVLFYFALYDHKFAILGDAGINAKVPAGFWDAIRDEMLTFFKNGDYIAGLEHGIHRAGLELAQDFPRKHNDTNELSNEISFG